MHPDLETELAVALAAVSEACRLTAAAQAHLVTEETAVKKDRSPVTVADFGAQALICRRLMEHFPEDPVAGEESAATLRPGGESAHLTDTIRDLVRAQRPDLDADAILAAIARGGHAGGRTGRFWTLDPVDGTKGFIRRDQYAVGLALIVDGQVALGVMGCPNLPPYPADSGVGPGALLAAIRSRGAFQFDAKTNRLEILHVSDRGPEEALFCESFEPSHSDQGRTAAVAVSLGLTAPPVRMDSMGKYGLVARGQADYYLRLPTRSEYMENIWDHAAGAVLATEAGGMVTDIDGRPLDFGAGRQLTGNRGIVVSNGRFHDRILDAVSRAMK